jgi:riboflavin synthase
MFTGIVEEVGKVISISNHRLVIGAAKITGCLELGDSVDVNGACLTVAQFDSNSFAVDIMEETLSRTSLGNLRPGSPVNLERALSLQKPLGGHLVQGHIDGAGYVISLNEREESVFLTISAPREIMRYVVEKGFIAVDGVSLTVTERTADSFTVSLVKFTSHHTTLSALEEGCPVNLEVDIIAKYIEQFSGKREEVINEDFLKQHGFLSS